MSLKFLSSRKCLGLLLRWPEEGRYVTWMVEAEDGPGELVRSLAADWCCWFRLLELECTFTL